MSDPSACVEAVFGQVQRERMAGLPILNPALHVQAVGFREWQGHRLGIVITPWCMSLLLLRGPQGDWTAVRGLERRYVEFPFGQLALLDGGEAALGEFQNCALFSPMERFATQAQAVEAARETMQLLLSPKAEPLPERAPQARSPARRRFLGLRPVAG